MVAQMASLTRQVESLQSDLKKMLAENISLQRQLAAARGVQQHQPYAATFSACNLPTIEQPHFAFTPPRQTADSSQHTPAPTVGAAIQDTTMADASPSRPASAGARRALSLGPHEAHDF